MNSQDVYALMRLLNYRGSGNTTLMLEGAKKYDRPFFICAHNTEAANFLVRHCGNPMAMPVGVAEMERTMSHVTPILIDHRAISEVIRKLQYDNNLLQERIERLRQEIKDLKDEKEALQETPKR